MSAQILIHPQTLRRMAVGEVIRRFGALGYMLCNTPARNLAAVRLCPSVRAQILSAAHQQAQQS